MKFKSLKIEVPTYGEYKDKLVCEIAISGERSTTTMVLPDAVAESIMQLAKEALIDGVSKAAEGFIFEITTHIPATVTPKLQ